MKYFFVFGNAPELARFELERVLGKRVTSGIVETDSPIKASAFAVLGGTVKAGEVFFEGSLPGVTEAIVNYLVGLGQVKITFGISVYGSAHGLISDAREIKEKLGGKGIRGRFILPTGGTQELSSVVVKKQRVVEILVLVRDNTAVLARTVFVQDFEDWGKRDYGRPEVSPHLGMLPPKVARMMVNASLPATILDPFCGVGTIAAEALSVGARVICSDLDPRQVERTRKNLEWLHDNFQFSIFNFQLIQADARRISGSLNDVKVDAVVTEPDLGPNTPIVRRIDGKVKERLASLYVESLADWRKVLKKGGRVVMVLPSFVDSRNSGPVSSDILESVIDKAKLMGYSLEAGPFPYFRAQAVVRRNVCVFRYGTH